MANTNSSPTSSPTNMILAIVAAVLVIAFIAWLGWHYFGPRPAPRGRYFMPIAPKASVVPPRPAGWISGASLTRTA